jgi:hypothetical protein
LWRAGADIRQTATAQSRQDHNQRRAVVGTDTDTHTWARAVLSISGAASDVTVTRPQNG